MTWYGVRRKQENEKLPVGYSHRNAGPLSLKVLAPFFLKVNSFWESPVDHNNNEYVLKDCEYTYKLYQFFKEKLHQEELYQFYAERLMPWTRMLTEAEVKGITIDSKLTLQLWGEATSKLELLKNQLDEAWIEPYKAYKQIQIEEIVARYNRMGAKRIDTYILKHGFKEDKVYEIGRKYNTMIDKQIVKIPDKMNLNSPNQLAWILRDHFGLDIKDYDDEESTGRQVLNRLAATGRKDIELFLEYRKYKKLATSFFPSYMELQYENKIH